MIKRKIVRIQITMRLLGAIFVLLSCLIASSSIDTNLTISNFAKEYQNSIDFYLEFKRDEFGKIINVYDNVVDTVDNLSDNEDTDETNKETRTSREFIKINTRS